MLCGIASAHAQGQNLTRCYLHTVLQPLPIVSGSFGVLWIPPKADPEARVPMQMFIWKVIPGSTRKVVGKVKQGKVPVKGTLVNRYLLAFKISKLNS